MLFYVIIVTKLHQVIELIIYNHLFKIEMLKYCYNINFCTN